MGNLPKIFIVLGLTLIVVGVLLGTAQRLPEGNVLERLGKLPGDIRVERKNYSFYFPWVTCLVISTLFSLVAWILQKIR